MFCRFAPNELEQAKKRREQKAREDALQEAALIKAEEEKAREIGTAFSRNKQRLLEMQDSFRAQHVHPRVEKIAEETARAVEKKLRWEGRGLFIHLEKTVNFKYKDGSTVNEFGETEDTYNIVEAAKNGTLEVESMFINYHKALKKYNDEGHEIEGVDFTFAISQEKVELKYEIAPRRGPIPKSGEYIDTLAEDALKLIERKYYRKFVRYSLPERQWPDPE